MLLRADPGGSFYTGAQATRAYTISLGTGTLSAGAFGINGRRGLRFNGDLSAGMEAAVSPSGATAIIGVSMRISSAPSASNRILQIREGSTFHTTVHINTDRTLSIYRDATELKALAYTFPLDTYIDLWFKATIGDSGSWELNVYENRSATAAFTDSATGVDTQNGGTGAWDALGIGAASDGNTDVCNIVMLDGSGSVLNDILGPTDPWALWANSRETAALTEWTLSSGSVPASVLDDVTPDDDTSYAEESTQDDELSVAVDRVPFPSRSILGAQLYACAKLTSGTPTVKPLARQDGTTYLGANQSPGASYAYVMQAYSAMPDGSAFSAATADDFDALQWGMALTSTSTTARLTQVVVVVIQAASQGKHNLLCGATHTVSGDDNLIAGQSNTVVGSASEAHGVAATVRALRTTLYALTGVAVEETEDGVFRVDANKIKLNGTLTNNGSSIGGSGAPVDAQYVTLAANGSLTNERVLTAGAGISITDGGAGSTVTVAATGTGQTVLLKGADQTVNNSTTLTNVTDFSFAIGANEIYWFDMELFYTAASAAADLKMGWSLPSGCTMRWGPMATSPGTTAFYFIPPTAGGAPTAFWTESTTPAIGTAASGNYAAHFRGLIINGANAGTVQFQFAQNTMTAADVTIMQYSLVRLTALA